MMTRDMLYFQWKLRTVKKPLWELCLAPEKACIYLLKASMYGTRVMTYNLSFQNVK